MEKAQKLFLTFVDQWRTGCNAKIQFHCESGRLMVDMQADLGHWKAQGCSLNKASPSRTRRRERRAAERDLAAATEEVVAAKAAADETTVKAAEEKTAKAAAEKAATRAAAEEVTAKAAAEEAAAKAAAVEVSAKAAGKEAATRAAAEENTAKEAAAKAAVEVSLKAAATEVVANAAGESAATTAAAVKVVATGAAAEEESRRRQMFESDQATTSGKNSQPLCWNCNCEMTPCHQCDKVSKVTPSVPTSSAQVSVSCGKQPLMTVKTDGGALGKTSGKASRCRVCAILGRDTFVSYDSRCPSCGMTASVLDKLI